MLGSHNSATYLNPRKWWMKPFSWMAKCQNNTILNQIQLGATVFDFRIRLKGYIDPDNLIKNVRIVHGLVEYGNNYTFECILNTIEFYTRQKQLYVIIVYDKQYGGKKYYNFYEKLIKELVQKYPSIDFQFVDDKSTWNIIKDFDKKTWSEEKVLYWKFSKKTPIPWPQLEDNEVMPFLKDIKDPNVLIWKDFIKF